jgi:hypothetical protein
MDYSLRFDLKAYAPWTDNPGPVLLDSDRKVALLQATLAFQGIMFLGVLMVLGQLEVDPRTGSGDGLRSQ